MSPSERAVAAARDAIGVRFRLHGRGQDGLDCIGLAGLALHAAGVELALPSGYALRSNDVARVVAVVEAAGLMAVGDRRDGDLLLLRAGPGQLHFAIQSGHGMIHADAMLRRVVERCEIPWPVLGRWRCRGD